MDNTSSQNMLYLIPLAVGISFLWKFGQWLKRIHQFSKQMPVIPVLFPPRSLYRRLWPARWQTFHSSWQVKNKRTLYQKLNSDKFVFVSLFQYDHIYISDPSTLIDVKITRADQFPRDVDSFKRVYPSIA
jgi:hypothetical protein